ncbi:MAG: bifunctional phosphopantothenoylcysteine decarboxylase/phosphopantothenate--cysteine ligase CoaBC [Proteobacteria bacterium]|nr:bifunctional phosphopantothenoylcysteine decarboxylase/phosphopantothenate--cysteine ligase CoaBC [Desulfobacula sp.]MBU4133583.1 bifunctional phosphopantothenoylcysteine decarboxylase/phosphopantothenate--cysteine ligase CoaBC [Pseudomonadota bacterium]
MEFKDRHILLGITGGIAAYKSVELLRLLKKAGADVHVAMTEAALQFVGRTTFEVLSENCVLTNLWKDTASSVTHIDIATSIDAAIIAPATANFIGKYAHGIADDALLTTLLAVTSPVMICPSMNTDMYQNIRVQRNLDILEQDGIHILDPDDGVLACKTVGAGRLPDPWFIFDRLCKLLTPKDLVGRQILVTAGPTIEAIDPVRYVSNHSSGKMGYAIAEAAEQRGARVTLISGPVSLDPPVGVECIFVESCEQMAAAVFSHLAAADIIVKVAAVADYRPIDPGTRKIKKNQASKEITIAMTENMDILNRIGELKTDRQFLVGFAAETNDLEKHALAKIKKKNLDMIAANLVGTGDSGFKTNTNKVKLFFKDGSSKDIPLMDKHKVAHILLDTIIEQTG